MENSEPDQRTPIYRNPFVWAAFIGMVLVTLMRPLLRHVPEPPPVIAQLPAFTLTDQNGRDFGSADLAGHVYVANFIFTSCPSYCPKLTKAMKFLQDRYADAGHDVRLVSFSVDPKRDTPEVLKRYGEKYGADFSRWTFLTGTEENLRAIIVDGFKAHFGPAGGDGGEDASLMEISHTLKFALVDADGGLRGYYDHDEAGLDELLHRSVHVLRAPSP